MPNRPCNQEGCQMTTEVFGEADMPEIRCLYPDTEWESATVNQTLECEACPALSIHCGRLIDVQIVPSKTKKITFSLHGTYNRPCGTEGIYMALQVSRDAQCPYSLLLKAPSYLCEAYNRNGLTLDISIPSNYHFSSIAINARSIHTSVFLSATNRIRLSADEDISAKLLSPRIYAYAKTGICVTCSAPKQSTMTDIICDDYVELTLNGYDAYELTCPRPDSIVSHKYKLSLFPVTFRGKVISKSEDVMIVE